MSIKKHLIFFTFLTGLFVLTSCNKDDDNPSGGIVGEGPIVTRTLSVTDFNGVDLATSPFVTIKQGTTQEITAMGQDNIIDIVSTDVQNGIWEIKFTESVSGNFDLSLEITVPNINSIEASSSGSIEVNDFTNQNGNLSIETSSSGSITLNQFEGISDLDATTSSSGSIFAREDISSLQNLTINLSSNGNYEGFALSGDDCTVTSSSSGKIELTANNTLDVTISSSGNVYYKGTPTITENITSSGMLIDAN